MAEVKDSQYGCSPEQEMQGQTSHAGPTGHEEVGLYAEQGSTLGELSVSRRRPHAGCRERSKEITGRLRGNSGEDGELCPSTELPFVL